MYRSHILTALFCAFLIFLCPACQKSGKNDPGQPTVYYASSFSPTPGDTLSTWNTGIASDETDEKLTPQFDDTPPPVSEDTLLSEASDAPYPPPQLKREGKNDFFETQVFGMNSFVRGVPGSFRIINFDSRGLKPVKGAQISISILDKGRITPLLSGTSDEQGTLEAYFRLTKPGADSRYLQVAARFGEAENILSIPINVKEPTTKIYLTTDKPLYQPNQKVHIRALAFVTEKMAPAKDYPILLEVEDSKSNLVFKKKAVTSKYGIASVTFQLADDINKGEYKIRASMGTISSEKTVTVKKYVLPKFKSTLTLDRSFYQPGMKLKGKLESRYFFGKPVTGAKVTLKMMNFDVAFNNFATIEGKTDKEGVYAFEQALPSYFAGQPLEQGKAFVQMDIDVVDTADHKESMTQRATVVKDPLQILMMPESKKLVPNLPNRIYVLTSYPDGSPAQCTLEMEAGASLKRTISTDNTGFSEFSFTPKENENIQLKASARDSRGDTASTSLTLQTGSASENLIVRLPRNNYRVGESLDLLVLCTQKRGTVYVDLIRNDQTILTKCVELENGKGRLIFNLTPDTTGQLTLHGYKFTSLGDLVRDTRTIVVNPANDLNIKVSLDKSTYTPGDKSNIRFEVRNKSGAPAQAALGIEIVDESLFALAEKQPGLEKIYFLLEKELMTPKYEICDHTASSLILDSREKEDQRTRNLTKLLFTQTIKEPGYRINLGTYGDKLAKVYQGLQANYSGAYSYYGRVKEYPSDSRKLAAEKYVSKQFEKDPWGQPYKIITLTWEKAFGDLYKGSYYSRDYTKQMVPNVICLGADGIEGTEDDIDYLACYKSGRLWGGYRGNRRGMPYSAKEQTSLSASGPAGGGGMTQPGGMLPAGRMQQESQANLAQGAPPARVREYFPETLFVNPQLITDEMGRASLEVTMADSITTWRMSAFANSLSGEMGNSTKGIRVFQDFFVDIDLPVALTQNDEVSLPLAVYNYLPGDQKVKIRIVKEGEPWYELMGREEVTLNMKKGEVTACYFRLKAKKVGLHKLTFYANGSKMSDAIRKEIEVLPDGKEYVQFSGDRLRGNVSKVITIPDNAIPDASRIQVTIYPGIFSQVVEGLDAMLRMPFG